MIWLSILQKASLFFFCAVYFMTCLLIFFLFSCKQETVILSINCSSAAKIAYKKISMQLDTSSRKFSLNYL